METWRSLDLHNNTPRWWSWLGGGGWVYAQSPVVLRPSFEFHESRHRSRCFGLVAPRIGPSTVFGSEPKKPARQNAVGFTTISAVAFNFTVNTPTVVTCSRNRPPTSRNE